MKPCCLASLEVPFLISFNGFVNMCVGKLCCKSAFNYSSYLIDENLIFNYFKRQCVECLQAFVDRIGIKM